MEDKVMEKEALAAAYGDMSMLESGSSSSIENEFAMLEAGSSVDDDLAALKAKLDSGES